MEEEEYEEEEIQMERVAFDDNIVEEIKKDVMRGNTMKKHIIELIKLYE